MSSQATPPVHPVHPVHPQTITSFSAPEVIHAPGILEAMPKPAFWERFRGRVPGDGEPNPPRAARMSLALRCRDPARERRTGWGIPAGRQGLRGFAPWRESRVAWAARPSISSRVCCSSGARVGVGGAHEDRKESVRRDAGMPDSGVEVDCSPTNHRPQGQPTAGGPSAKAGGVLRTSSWTTT